MNMSGIFVSMILTIKKSIFYCKNHRTKIPNIFVYITPEKTRKHRFSEKYHRKIDLTPVPAELEAN